MTNNKVIKSYATAVWIKSFLFVCVVLISLVLVFTDNKWWVSLGLMIFLLFLILGLVLSFIDGLVINEDVLIITKNGLKTKIDRGDVKQITWAKGCPTTIVYGQDKKIDISDIDVSPLPFRNEIMRWNEG